MFPYWNTYRLYERGGAGVCCDVDGVSLGPLKLVERAGKGYFVRPVEDITLMLEAAYGPLPEVAAGDLAQKIVGIARSLNGGELVQAMFKTLYLRLPEIPCENLAKMNRLAMGGANSRRRVDMAAAERAAGELGDALSKAFLQREKVQEDMEKGAACELVKANFNPDECRDDFGRWCGDPGAISVYHGKKYSVSARTAGNIIYNETRSFSGPQRDEAMSHIAHVIYNRADAGKPIGGNQTSSPNVDATKVPKVEQETYVAAQAAAVRALKDRTDNKADPTGGAAYYNFRGSNSKEPRNGYEHSTQIGPFNNSYPTDGKNGHKKDENNLPDAGVYVNTYYSRQVAKPKK